MATLICHGICNPHREEIDRDVRDKRRCESMRKLPVSRALADRLRTLRHTTHRPRVGVLTDTWVCVTCGTPRRWGSSLAWAGAWLRDQEHVHV